MIEITIAKEWAEEIVLKGSVNKTKVTITFEVPKYTEMISTTIEVDGVSIKVTLLVFPKIEDELAAFYEVINEEFYEVINEV